MKIALVAPARHPISEPYPGGLEAFCGILTQALRRRGHQVDLYASAGSTGHVRDFEFPAADWSQCPHLENDTTYPPGYPELESHFFARLRGHLEHSNYDVVHNNSLHPALLESTTLPLVTTLHCPPVAPMSEAATECPGRFVAVSNATARSWGLESTQVIYNSVDTSVWCPGPGGDHAVFFGRFTPEKAPHVAIDASRRAGLPIKLIGRPADPHYVQTQIVPRLGPDVLIEKPLPHRELAREIGCARVAVIPPAWDEPFGLVSIEAMATGTPVAAFARGGLHEVLAGSPCPPVAPNDVDALAEAICRAGAIEREEVSLFARQRFGIDRLIDQYEQVYRQVARSAGHDQQMAGAKLA
ncbi:glycosyltransferase family 4 protein [Corynebacterium tapiri]|uniref:Glycosyltransferase family 4 protein n=1 Tax=Corynebacterium tapiri TaxID=1448266 RepID=A0A5C4U5U8_9CORY|nr:glycosyltransferase family 4 protein [Corynebacterium tapiri]TNL99769.1 glycosyltransferase family 4 protein [Corynebacterium tapiri]